MKSGYKKLLIYELFLIIFITLLFNVVFINFNSNYILTAFLIISLIIFKIIFGFEKDNHRYVKDIILDISIYLFIFFIIYYLFGILITFAKTENYFSFKGIFLFVIPLILNIILKEYLRYMMLCKSENDSLTTFTAVILFIFLDIITSLSYSSLSTYFSVFVFVSRIILPSIITNILATYISFKFGYKPIIFYLLIMSLYQVLIPIVPNFNEYVYVLIIILLPIIILSRVYSFVRKSNDEYIERDYYKKRYKLLSLIPVYLFVMILVYFYSGYFKYWTIAIASGSMSDKINKGDMVVINKKVNKNKLDVGQVIAYKYENMIIVHRIVEVIISKDDNYYITKGDANEVRDGWLIDNDMIIGLVEYKIPYIGIPTIWVNELLD